MQNYHYVKMKLKKKKLAKNKFLRKKIIPKKKKLIAVTKLLDLGRFIEAQKNTKIVPSTRSGRVFNY